MRNEHVADTWRSALNCTSLIPLLTGYGVTVGALYLWGYWSKFHVNILEHVGLLDIAVAAAFPLVSAFIGVVAAIVVGLFIPSDGALGQRHRESPIGQLLTRNQRKLFMVHALVLLACSVLIPPDARAFILPLLLWPLVVFALVKRGILSDVIQDAATRTTVTMILALIACLAFGQGRLDAATLVAGREYFAVDPRTLRNIPETYVRQVGDFKYLGLAGDHIFVLAPDSALLMLRNEAMPSLVLVHRSTPRPRALGELNP